MWATGLVLNGSMADRPDARDRSMRPRFSEERFDAEVVAVCYTHAAKHVDKA